MQGRGEDIVFHWVHAFHVAGCCPLEASGLAQRDQRALSVAASSHPTGWPGLGRKARWHCGAAARRRVGRPRGGPLSCRQRRGAPGTWPRPAPSWSAWAPQTARAPWRTPGRRGRRCGVGGAGKERSAGHEVQGLVKKWREQWCQRTGDHFVLGRLTGKWVAWGFCLTGGTHDRASAAGMPSVPARQAPCAPSPHGGLHPNLAALDAFHLGGAQHGAPRVDLGLVPHLQVHLQAGGAGSRGHAALAGRDSGARQCGQGRQVQA